MGHPITTRSVVQSLQKTSLSMTLKPRLSLSQSCVCVHDRKHIQEDNKELCECVNVSYRLCGARDEVMTTM